MSRFVGVWLALLVVGTPLETHAQPAPVPDASTTVDGLRARALAARAERRFDDALQALETAIALRPDDLGLALERAVTFAFAGRLREALAAYRHARGLDEASVAAACGEARVLGWLGRRREARAQLRRWRARAPDALEVRTTLGDLEANALRRVHARHAYREVLRRDPANAAARDGLARLARSERVVLRAASDWTRTPSGHRFGGSAALGVTLVPELRLAFEYTTSGAALSVSDPSARQVGRAHRVDAAAIVRVSETLTLEARYQAVSVATTEHRAGARMSVRASEHLVLEGGALAGRAPTGGSVLLVDAGVVVPFRERFVLGHLFVNRTGRDVAVTGSLGGIVPLGATVRARVGASLGRLPFGTLYGASARLEIRAGRRTTTFVASEWNGGCISRFAASVGIEVRR